MKTLILGTYIVVQTDLDYWRKICRFLAFFDKISIFRRNSKPTRQVVVASNELRRCEFFTSWFFLSNFFFFVGLRIIARLQNAALLVKSILSKKERDISPRVDWLTMRSNTGNTFRRFWSFWSLACSFQFLLGFSFRFGWCCDQWI